MLGKLFKHEMKACARLLLPLYLVLAVFTIMDRIVINLNIFKGVLQLIPGTITFLYILSILAISVVSFVIIILRFYRNLMTDEGYLMFTLPVKTHELIDSKLLVSVIWTVASVAGVVLSIFAVLVNNSRMHELQEGIQQMLSELHSDIGNYTALFIAEFAILFIISLFSNILEIYVSIAIGQLFHEHKIIGSFGAYIVINIVLQFVVTILIAVGVLLFTDKFNDILSVPQIIMPATIVISLGLTIAYYFVTNYIFKKRINLD